MGALGFPYGADAAAWECWIRGRLRRPFLHDGMPEMAAYVPERLAEIAWRRLPVPSRRGNSIMPEWFPRERSQLDHSEEFQRDAWHCAVDTGIKDAQYSD